MNAKPILEDAINSSKQDIDGVRRSLQALHNLAVILPESHSDSPVYRYNKDGSTLRFPPSLASVIYAAFHKEDDPDYFYVIAEAVTGNASSRFVEQKAQSITNDAGLRYDPASMRIVPVGNANANPESRVALAQDSRNVPAYGGTTGGPGAAGRAARKEYRKVIAGFLNHPDQLKKLGNEFGVYLFDLLDHIEEKQNDKALLSDLKYIMDNYRKEYVAELVTFQGVKTGEFEKDGKTPEVKFLEPKFAQDVSNEELYVYIGCRMSEKYGTDVSAAITNAVKTPSDMKTVSVQDTADFVKNWIEGEGMPVGSSEQENEGSQEYLALKFNNVDLDLYGAPVAPEYLIPMFAKDCSCFIEPRGAKAITDTGLIQFGYSNIADVLGIGLRPFDSDKEDTADYMDYMCDTINATLAGLVNNPQKANDVHNSAIEKLNAKIGSETDETKKEVLDRIRRQVFQDKGDGEVIRYPGVSGTGNEIFLRRTSVAKGNITRRILRAVRRYSDKFIVESDDKNTGKCVVKVGKDSVTVDKNNPENARNYIMSSLFPYLDSTSSFTTYAIWEGIVPYSRVVDNKLEYLNDDSEELYAARAREGEDIAGDVMTAGIGRNPAVAMTKNTEFGSNEILNDKDVLAQTLAKPAANQKLTNEEIVEKLTPQALRAYAIMNNIEAYDAAFKSMLSNGIPENIAPVKLAFRDVYGSIATMVSNKSREELDKRIEDKAIRYAIAIQGNAMDASVPKAEDNAEIYDAVRMETKGYSKELADELFENLKNVNIPAEIAKAYGDNEDAMITAFRTMLYDLAAAAMAVAEGYGYHGLNVSNTYSGGKYTSGNRIMVNYGSDGANEPIFDFQGAGVMRSFAEIGEERETEMAIITKAIESLRDSSVANRPEQHRVEQTILTKRLLANVPVPASIKDAAMEQAMNAIVKPDGKYTEFERSYATLFAIFSTLILDGPVTKDVNIGMTRSIGGNTAIKQIKKVIASTNTGKTIKTLDRVRANLSALTDNGKLIEGLSSAFMGTEVGDEAEHDAYGELAASAIGAMSSISDMASLKDAIGTFFKTSPRRRSRLPESETVPLDDVAGELTAPEAKSDLYSSVEDALKQWKPDSSGMYNGLTGKFGIDTIKTGDSGVTSSAMTPLTSGETAFTGLSKSAVDKCVAYIQSARDDIEEFSERHGKGLTNIGELAVKQLWADDVINYIGSNYMESNLKLGFQTVDGKRMLSEQSVEEWKNLVKETIGGVLNRCNIKNAATASIRYEIAKFVTENLTVSSSGSVNDISRISTAFAHIILRLGDTTRQQAVPNPFTGHQVPSSKIPSELSEIGKQRSLGNDEDNQVDYRELRKGATNKLIDDDMLSRELSSIYSDLQMDATEGADRYLNFFAAAIHKAENKVLGTDREKNAHIAPNKWTATLYGCILDDEARNDKRYTSVVNEINKRITSENENEKITTVNELLSESGLYGKINNGPMAGMSYADAAFGQDTVEAISSWKAAKVMSQQEVVDYFVTGLRIQIADRLLSGRTFEWLKKNMPETMEKMVNTFFSLAQNLDSGHTATIFAVLDPAERNIGNFTRLKNVKSETSDDYTLGSVYDADEGMKAATGEYPVHKIQDEEGLKTAITTLVELGNTATPEVNKKRDELYKKLEGIAGKNGVTYLQNTMNTDSVRDIIDSGSVRDTNALVNNLIKRVTTIVATDPRKVYDAASRVEDVEAKLYERLNKAIYNIYTKRGNTDPDSKESVRDSVQFINDMFGRAADGFIGDVLWYMKSHHTKPDEVKDTIDNMVDAFRSGKNIYPELVERYAKKMVAPKGAAARKEAEAKKMLDEPVETPTIGSYNAQNRRMREVGGDYGTNYLADPRPENLSAIKEMVRKELMSIDVAAAHSDKQIRDSYVDRLKRIGFEGSIDSFCNAVLDKDGLVDPQHKADVAEEYAFNTKNYDMGAINQKLSGAMGSTAREAAHTPKGGELDEGMIRLIAKSDIPHISMATDRNGDEIDSIIIGNSGLIPINSPTARAQMTLIVNRAESMTGKSLINSNGSIDRDVAKAMGQVAAGNTSPVDPMIAGKNLGDAVVSILLNSKWVTDNGKGQIVRKFNARGKDKSGGVYGFVATIGKDKIRKYVQSLATSRFGGVTQDSLKQEMMQYVTLTKENRTGSLPTLEKIIKGYIDSLTSSMAKAMIASGDRVATKDGVTVTLVNAPENVPPDAGNSSSGEPKPKRPKDTPNSKKSV